MFARSWGVSAEAAPAATSPSPSATAAAAIRHFPIPASRLGLAGLGIYGFDRTLWNEESQPL